MIKRIIILIFFGIGALTMTLRVNAMDLVQAYQAALQNDPTFKQALADYLENKQATAISRAALLPQLSLNALFSRNQFRQFDISGTVNAHDFAALFTQTIFDANAFATLARAHSVVKQAAYQLAAAQQNLMFRVATAYFQVLRAEDILYYTFLQKQANMRQLNIIIERMKAGHTTITAVDQARASYDFVRARYVREKINLANAKHALEAIIGVPIGKLNTLKADFPLIKPIPQRLDAWLMLAGTQNLQVLSTHYGVIAAHRAISAEQANHLPTVNFTGQYLDTNEPIAGAVEISNLRTKEALAGVEFNLPVFQGGLIVARVRAAIAAYQRAVAQMQFAHYEAIQNAKDAYTGVMLGVDEVRASHLAVLSNRDAYLHTLESYKAGMETVLNLLQQLNQLYDAARNYATNRYIYILNVIQLEEAAGILKPITLYEINKWLEYPKPRKKPKKRLKPYEFHSEDILSDDDVPNFNSHSHGNTNHRDISYYNKYLIKTKRQIVSKHLTREKLPTPTSAFHHNQIKKNHRILQNQKNNTEEKKENPTQLKNHGQQSLLILPNPAATEKTNNWLTAVDF